MPPPKNYTDAINFAMSNARSSGRTSAGFPKLTNRDASGLILFAKALLDHARSQGQPFAFDWYAFSLPALGWKQPGDRFVMTIAQQNATYPRTNELWHELAGIAAQLDAGGVPFWIPRDPTGTETTYKQVASQAWDEMKRAHPDDAKKSAKPTPKPKPQPTPTPTPETPGPVIQPAMATPVQCQPAPVLEREEPSPDAGGGGGGALILGLALLLLASD